MLDLSKYKVINQNPSMLQQAKEMWTGSDRETRGTRELPELGSGGLLSGMDLGDTIKGTLATAITMDPRELANILGTIEGIGITEDEKGNLYASNNKTGVQVVINKPGMSKLDIIQGLGLAAMFTPAGRAVGTVAKLGTKMAVGAGTSAATEAAIQGTQAALGGEFNPEDVALMGGMGVAAPLIAPAAKQLGALAKQAPAVTSKVVDLSKYLVKKVNPLTVVKKVASAPVESAVWAAGTKVFPAGGGALALAAYKAVTKKIKNLLKIKETKTLTPKQQEALNKANAKAEELLIKAEVKKSNRDAFLKRQEEKSAKDKAEAIANPKPKKVEEVKKVQTAAEKQKGADMLAKIRSRKQPDIKSNVVEEVADPIKQSTMKILNLQNRIKKETNPGKIKILEAQIAAEERKLGG